MQRGDVYLVVRPSRDDPRGRRAVVVVSRPTLIDSPFGSVICAPIYSRLGDIATQVEVGPESGIQHASGVYCDNLMSIPKRELTNYVGHLDDERLHRVDLALARALAIDYLIEPERSS